MRDGFHAASGEVQVCDRTVIEDGQRAVEPLRGEVHVTLRTERSGRDEEHLLLLDELAQLGDDRVVGLGHEGYLDTPRPVL